MLCYKFSHISVSFTLQAPGGPPSRLGLSVMTTPRGGPDRRPQVGVMWSPSQERGSFTGEQSKQITASAGVPLSGDKRAKETLLLAEGELSGL